MLGKVPFRGIVDRIDIESDGLVVTDYKSGTAPSKRAYPKRLRQVLLYSAAVSAHTGETPVRARLYYLGQKVVNTQVTEDNLADVVEDFATTWHGITRACESDIFKPRPSRLCNYCPYIEHCPEGKDDVARRAAEQAAADESLSSFVDCLLGV